MPNAIMKKLIFLLFPLLFSCKDEVLVSENVKDISMISIEYSEGNSLSKDVLINMKGKYILYANKGVPVAPENFEKDNIRSKDTKFELNDEDIKEIIKVYGRIDYEDKSENKDSELFTNIKTEGKDGKLVVRHKANKRNYTERAFLEKILVLIVSKTKDVRVEREIDMLLSKL